MCVKDARIENGVSGAIDANFMVIWVREDNQELEKNLDKACVGCYDPNKSLGDDGWRSFYKVTKPVEGSFTQPKFVQKYKIFDNTTRTSPVYVVFKAPNATDKFREWLKKNGYSNPDFQIQTEFESKVETNHVVHTKGVSELSISAYYESGGRLYMWDGSSVSDFSEGFTSNANGGEKEIRKMIRLLKKIGE